MYSARGAVADQYETLGWPSAVKPSFHNTSCILFPIHKSKGHFFLDSRDVLSIKKRKRGNQTSCGISLFSLAKWPALGPFHLTLGTTGA